MLSTILLSRFTLAPGDPLGPQSGDDVSSGFRINMSQPVPHPMFLLFLLSLVAAVQQPLDGVEKLRVAIIGAGAGGSSAAYYLNTYANASTEVVVFDKNDYVGGRSTTVYIYGNESLPIELGASVFVSINTILTLAVEEFGFETQLFGGDGDTGVWDGASLVTRLSGSISGTFDLVWRYGLAPLRLVLLVNRFAKAFHEYFYYLAFPFANLTEVVDASGFSLATSQSASTYFSKQNIALLFVHDVAQAFSRVNYASNLDQIHGVGGLVSCATTGAVQVVGGNWQIFAEFLNRSNADVRLQTPVTNLTRVDNQWQVSFTAANGTNSSELFDRVVVAAPIHQTGLGLDYKPVEYVKLYVTLIAANDTLDSTHFGLDEVPASVLTTTGHDPEFFSASINTFVEDTGDYVYKIFSLYEVSDDQITELFGDATVSWVHRKQWYSYPRLVPTTDFGLFDLGNGLYYLNAIESFISTMETSALAGANVAALISEGRNQTELVL